MVVLQGASWIPMTQISHGIILAACSVLHSRKTGGISKPVDFGKTDVDMLTHFGQMEKALPLAAWVVPGHTDDQITIYAGLVARVVGRVADGVGQNAYALRTEANPLYIKQHR